MESIGEKLRVSREEKSLSVDQVARDTNIAKRYILALESEDFSEFPGEPYLIGFLRNYADYLGLDAEEIVGLYRNFKIQEQPLPMEELLESTNRSRGPLIILGVLLLIALIVLGVLFLPSLLSKGSGRATEQTTQPAVTGGGTVYQLSDEIVERRFVSGDTVVVPVGGKSYRVKLSVSGRDLILSDANGRQTVKLGEEKAIDLNGNGTPDLKVFFRDIDTQDPAKGIIVRFDRFTQSPNAPAQNTPAAATATPAPVSSPKTATSTAPAATQPATTQPAATQPAATQPAATQPATTQPAATQPAATTPQPAAQAPPANQSQPAVTAASPAASTPAPTGNSTGVPTITPQAAPPSSAPVVITSAPASTPFSVTISFTADCLFRYLIDGQAEDQRYFQKGETTRLEAKQDVEIWASNGGALMVDVLGNSVEMGNPGQAIVRDIAWVKNPDGSGYQLQMTRLQ